MSVPDSEEWCCEVAVNHSEWGGSRCCSERACVWAVFDSVQGSKKPSEKWHLLHRLSLLLLVYVGPLCLPWSDPYFKYSSVTFPTVLLICSIEYMSLRTTVIQVYSFLIWCTFKNFLPVDIKRRNSKMMFQSLCWPGAVKPWKEIKSTIQLSCIVAQMACVVCFWHQTICSSSLTCTYAWCKNVFDIKIFTK